MVEVELERSQNTSIWLLDDGYSKTWQVNNVFFGDRDKAWEYYRKLIKG